MSDEREPLWSNQRILDRYYALVPCEANMGDMEYWRTLRDVGERVSYELRNDYEARVTELEAQLAQTTQQPAIPPDVRETLRETLEWRKQWMKATGDQLTVNSIDEVDAALTWLDQQEPTL